MTPRHRVFYIVAALVLFCLVWATQRLSATSDAQSISAYIDDFNSKVDEIRLPDKKDPHESEMEMMKYLNTDDSGRMDDIAGLTDEEIREQLEMIKKQQIIREQRINGDHVRLDDRYSLDKVEGTLLDNPRRVRLDKSPPDSQPWAQYELDRVSPKVNAYARENATLFTLCRNKELYEILNSIQQMEIRFNNIHHYDWVFLNDEPFSDEFIELTSNMVSGRARYGLIPHEHWSYPDHIDQERAKSVRESKKWSMITYGTSESYRHMCRFNSMFFYKHPIMQEYQYFWRVEPEVSYHCDILEDPFKTLKDNDMMYGFTISMEELPNTIETLWSTSKLYFDQDEIQSALPEDNLLKFVSNDGGDSYNLCHFWSNFEVVNLDFYRSALYEGYVDYLDHAGGFFYERWGDAPIHSIAASLILPKNQIYLFQNISYEHTVAKTCPLNDQYLKLAKCTCDPTLDWTMRSQSSCNIKFLEVSDQVKNDDFDKYYTKIQNRILEEEEMRQRQRQLRLENARRQAQLRKAKAQERKVIKKKEDAAKRERGRERRVAAAKEPNA